jgi:hypothetical protein
MISSTKNYFTPFLLCPLMNMNNNSVLYLTSGTPTPYLRLQQSYKNNKNNNLIVYYNIVLEKKETEKKQTAAGDRS